MNCSFNSALASKYGIEEAIIIELFDQWLYHNRQKSTKKRGGLLWVSATFQDLHLELPFISVPGIKRCITQLKDEDVLCIEKLDKSKGKMTNFYRFTDQFINELNALPSVDYNDSTISYYGENQQTTNNKTLYMPDKQHNPKTNYGGENSDSIPYRDKNISINTNIKKANENLSEMEEKKPYVDEDQIYELLDMQPMAWKDKVRKEVNLTEELFNEWMKRFADEKSFEGVSYISPKDIRGHFSRWLKLQRTHHATVGEGEEEKRYFMNKVYWETCKEYGSEHPDYVDFVLYIHGLNKLEYVFERCAEMQPLTLREYQDVMTRVVDKKHLLEILEKIENFSYKQQSLYLTIKQQLQYERNQ